MGRPIGSLLAAVSAALALWLFVRWSLLGPVLMLEPAVSAKPITRSAQIVRGHFWRVVGAWLTLWLFTAPGVLLTYLSVNMQTQQIVNLPTYWFSHVLSAVALPVLWTGTVAIYRSLAVPEDTMARAANSHE